MKSESKVKPASNFDMSNERAKQSQLLIRKGLGRVLACVLLVTGSFISV